MDEEKTGQAMLCRLLSSQSADSYRYKLGACDNYTGSGMLGWPIGLLQLMIPTP